MSCQTLQENNRPTVLAQLDGWFVACLCAAWCGTCDEYRPRLEQLAARFPNVPMLWIDIEDEADVVGELDIDNFPTLLIQHGDTVAFFGTVLPDLALAERLLQAQLEQDPATLLQQAQASPEKREWQRTVNLRRMLADSLA
jgi:thioredoxin-like negative regulator of GroEL